MVASLERLDTAARGVKGAMKLIPATVIAAAAVLMPAVASAQDRFPQGPPAPLPGPGVSVLNYGHCIADGSVEPTPPGGPEEAPGISLIGPGGGTLVEPVFGDAIMSSNGPSNSHTSHFIGGVACSHA